MIFEEVLKFLAGLTMTCYSEKMMTFSRLGFMPNSNQKSRVLHNYVLPSVFLLEFDGQHQNNKEIFHDSDRILVRKVAGEFSGIY